MTKIIRGTLAVAVSLVVLTTPAFAQSLVRGSVTDQEDKPIADAVIVFESVTNQAKRDTKTNNRGEYLFLGLQSGDYAVTASKDGFASSTKQLTVTQSKISLSFTLAPPAVDTHAGFVFTPGAEAVTYNKETAALQALAASAVAAVNSERYEEAIPQLMELIEKAPTCAECLLHLGNSYAALKRDAEAEDAWKRSIAIEPSVNAYTGLTRMYNSQRKFDLAAEASEKAAALDAARRASAEAGGAAAGPAVSSETLFNQGVVLWNAGKFEEARDRFAEATKADPRNADAQYQLGLASLNLGQLPAARQAFEAYLVAAPDGARAGEVKALLGQLPK